MIRIHASYHKCLTMYFLRTAHAGLNKYALSRKKKYKHFESIEGLFYNTMQDYDICSINNFAPNLNNIKDDFRITRFIRDPRDLIISGYFYHKRGAEPWFRFKNPTTNYWASINGNIPKDLPANCSFAEYLNTLNLSEGITKEIEFRKFHLESYRDWADDPRIKIFKYEDIITDQVNAFRNILEHLEVNSWHKKKLLFFAKKYALQNRKNDKHIRNPNSGQWRTYFTPEMNKTFINNYGDILERYNYPET